MHQHKLRAPQAEPFGQLLGFTLEQEIAYFPVQKTTKQDAALLVNKLTGNKDVQESHLDLFNLMSQWIDIRVLPCF